MELPLLVALREEGSVDPAVDPGLTRADVLSLFRFMVLLRVLDEKAVNLQRTGRIGFYVPCAGQEAAEIGSASAVRKGDWIFPSYREQGAALVCGYPLSALLGQLYGNASDAVKGRQMPNHFCDRSINLVSVSSPVATQLPQAVGAAYVMRLRKEKAAAIAYFGDGATSTGAFHAAMNFAAVFKTPTVFFCSNNQYAISLPWPHQSGVRSVAQKASGYGMPGVRVDGNDVLAVARVVRDAMERARAGDGPTLIEAVTYRMGPHTTSDDPSRYRAREERDRWAKKDPLRRVAAYLKREGFLDADGVRRLEEEAREEVARAVRECEGSASVRPETLVEDVYAEMPWHLVEQRAWLPAGTE